jgi:hypothetical protein
MNPCACSSSGFDVCPVCMPMKLRSFHAKGKYPDTDEGRLESWSAWQQASTLYHRDPKYLSALDASRKEAARQREQAQYHEQEAARLTLQEQGVDSPSHDALRERLNKPTVTQVITTELSQDVLRKALAAGRDDSHDEPPLLAPPSKEVETTNTLESQRYAFVKDALHRKP